MSDSTKTKALSASITWLKDNYQWHPSMLQLQILRLKLKQEKLKDKLVYQSIKDQIASR